MMADIEDKSQEALSIHELDAANKLGLSVMACPYCQRPTLWIANKDKTNTPASCGRVPCVEGYGAEER